MNPQLWYLATCEECEPQLPQPFRGEADRDEWATKHAAATGHTVTRSEQDQ